jgi:hypothetical protein
MDNETKIHLSPFEMDLLNNSDWILTKNRIVKKAQQLLAEVQQNIFDYTRQHINLFPPEAIAISPKISKGENYNGLPWLMLDYPRYFNKENIFVIRIMFWWGNFFSTTLHLSGACKQKYCDGITKSYEELCKNEFYYCINDDQWNHHFEKTNYLPVKSFSSEEFIEKATERSFIKLSCKFPLTEWNDAIKLLSENFARIANWLG